MQQLSFWKRIRLFSAQHNMGWKGTVLLGLALLGTLLTMGGTFVHAQVAPARILVASATALHASTDCSYTASQGWTCPLTLSRSDSSTADLAWSALSVSGILVTPATGTLLPGGTMAVSITVADRSCPSSSTVSLKGPNNTVKVRWSCSAIPLTLTPTQFVANSQCPATSGGWQCSAVVGEAATSQGTLNWSAKSYLSGVTFTPASGVLSPGASTPVSIFIPQGTTCASGNFSFAGQGSNSITAHWMCKVVPPKVTIDEFPLPTPNSSPWGITAGPDGNLWFTDTRGSIGRITPNGSVTEFPLPTPNSDPKSITSGPDGNLWFTEDSNNSIGRITPNGSVTEFPIPTTSNSHSRPLGITAGPDGNLWFTEGGLTNEIGRIQPNGSISMIPLPTGNFPSDITAGPDGNLWFLDIRGSTNEIGRIQTYGYITLFPLPPSNGEPYDITAGPDGNLWFTELYNNNIWRITPSGSVTLFPLPTPDSFPSFPTSITAGPDGNLWFTDEHINGTSQIGRITPTDTITLFPLPSSSYPKDITEGPDGNLWFTDENGSIGRVTLP